MWEFCWQTGQRVASARASRRASMSVAGMSSSSAGCPSQSRTGSCRRCHVAPDWAGLDHGALSSGRLWFQSAGRPPGQATAGCHPPARAAAGKAGVWRGQADVRDSLPSVSDRYPRLRGFRESTLVSPLSARSIPAPLGTRRRLRSPGSSVPLVRGVARWSVPDARPRGQLPGAPPPVLLPPAGWACLLPRKSPAWGTPVLRVL